MDKNLEVSFLLDFYGDILKDKQKQAIEYYYNDDLSLSEIADNQGITRQGVRDTIKRAELCMYEMEERLGLAKRFNQMQQGMKEILDLTNNIEKINNNGYKSKEIQDSADDIKKIIKEICK